MNIQNPRDYIIHFPVIDKSLKSLSDIRGLILVGSAARAGFLATLLASKAGFNSFEYCSPQSASTEREYSLYAIPEAQIAVCSHGIGVSGVEICLAEIPALIALAGGTGLEAVIRAGTRGSLEAGFPLGAIGLSSSAIGFLGGAELFPDQALFTCLQAVCAESEQQTMTGKCLSAQYFWTGQGRQPYPLLSRGAFAKNNELNFYRDCKEAKLSWIEMEDAALYKLALLFGFKAAALGLVVAKRELSADQRQLLSGYQKASLEEQLLPGVFAFQALQRFLGVAYRAQVGAP